nr:MULTISPECIES: lysozyme family protein [Clostridia]
MIVLFGSVLSVSGGNNGIIDNLISVEVRQYESIIWRYASQYGIEDYTELIKAVMMQESGGRGQDPMQSSECGYNNRYPHTPNGITDPAYSIECGVQMLRDSIQMADVKNPIDITRIKLALQGYNFGNAYIDWAIEKDGKYTAANAAQYSDMMAQRMGWSSYGDKEYAFHVLRYYAFREVERGGGSKAIVEVALSQVGNLGGEPYWRWYGFSRREEWCACFVSWCAEQCGYIESGVVPKFAYCPTGVAWFQEHGRWKGRDYVPASGDIIFFDSDGDGISEHVGIVEKVEDGMLYTVEGNYEDEFSKANYPIDYIGINGYGINDSPFEIEYTN